MGEFEGVVFSSGFHFCADVIHKERKGSTQPTTDQNCWSDKSIGMRIAQLHPYYRASSLGRCDERDPPKFRGAGWNTRRSRRAPPCVVAVPFRSPLLSPCSLRYLPYHHQSRQVSYLKRHTAVSQRPCAKIAKN